MTRPRLLVVSVVHHADDTRIREKTIRTLAEDWDVVYRTRGPAPTDLADVTWRELPGGRVARNVEALRALLTHDYDVAQIHDPELVPAAVLARLARGKRIVFDVHEHIPGQISTKEWVPARRTVARLAAWMLRVTEPILDITLAEAGYRDLFADPHPVFANYPDHIEPMATVDRSHGEVVYLGSVSVERGALLLVDAMPSEGTLTIIGPCQEELARELQRRAEARGLRLQLLGRLPHRSALERAAQGAVGVSPLFDTPNYRHSLPTKVLEYLSVGLPVIASDLPGTREVVGNEPSVLLVAPGDEAAWREALRTQLGRSVRPDVSAQRSLQWPRHEVREFYRRLIDS